MRKIRDRFFWRIFGGYVVITILLSVLILAVSFSAIKKNNVRILTEDLTQLGTVLKASVAPMVEQENIAGLDKFIKRSALNQSMRFTVIRADGKVLADSQTDPAQMENHSDRTEVAQALRGERAVAQRFSQTLREEMLYVAQPLLYQGKVRAIVRTSVPVWKMKTLLNTLKRTILGYAVILSLLSLLLWTLLSWLMIKPLREIQEVSQKMSAGDLKARILIRSNSGLGELARSFNSMAEHLQQLFEELTRQKAELGSIIESMQEGLAVIDQAGRFKLTNRSFRALFRLGEPGNKYYWELIRDDGFAALCKRLQKEKKEISTQTSIQDRAYAVSGVFLPASGDLILILRDITEAQDLEKIKKDFVVNVSHELRTPLTAIKGYLETLHEEVPEAQRRYVEVIGKNTERLIAIVKDLLLLSELEEKSFDLKKEDVDVNVLLENVRTVLESKAKTKGLDLIITPEPGLPLIKGDSFKLEQLLINLLDNAIKYTEQGSVQVKIAKVGDALALTVQDTGVGIPQEDLPRIFERFYVVDKSRSRKVGGTGLGLSIVKHIVLLHNGKIEVESQPGQGTKFIITLPIE
jgi:two-component system phosphate regulon sensor histidine kinase PhoR